MFHHEIRRRIGDPPSTTRPLKGRTYVIFGVSLTHDPVLQQPVPLKGRTYLGDVLRRAMRLQQLVPPQRRTYEDERGDDPAA